MTAVTQLLDAAAATGENGYVMKLTAAGAFVWVSPFLNQSSAATNACLDLVVDGAGNVVVGGSYRGPVDFKPGGGTTILPYYSNTTGGGFVAMLAPSTGSLIWAQPVGAVGLSAVRSLTVDAAGNIYAQGLLQGQVDFDRGAGITLLTSNGSTDVYVAKFTSSGAFVWAVSFGGTGMDWSQGVAVDRSGNVYVAGYYSGTVDFNPDPAATYQLTSAGQNDIFLTKLTQR